MQKIILIIGTLIMCLLFTGSCGDYIVEPAETIIFEMPGWVVGNYSGGLKNGVPHGEGVWDSPEGGRYEGSWFEGQYHGFGTFTWPDERVYRGEWQYGYHHGKGSKTYPDGKLQEGRWEEGRLVEIKQN